MNLSMGGIDYQIAPVDIRERFSYTRTSTRDALLSWKNQVGANACVLLSTCNPDELEDCYGALPEVAQKVGGTR